MKKLCLLLLISTISVAYSSDLIFDPVSIDGYEIRISGDKIPLENGIRFFLEVDDYSLPDSINIVDYYKEISKKGIILDKEIYQNYEYYFLSDKSLNEDSIKNKIFSILSNIMDYWSCYCLKSYIYEDEQGYVRIRKIKGEAIKFSLNDAAKELQESINQYYKKDYAYLLTSITECNSDFSEETILCSHNFEIVDGDYEDVFVEGYIVEFWVDQIVKGRSVICKSIDFIDSLYHSSDQLIKSIFDNGVLYENYLSHSFVKSHLGSYRSDYSPTSSNYALNLYIYLQSQTDNSYLLTKTYSGGDVIYIGIRKIYGTFWKIPVDVIQDLEITNTLDYELFYKKEFFYSIKKPFIIEMPKEFENR